MLQQPDAWDVEGVLRRHDAKEVGERLLREHRVGVCVGQLGTHKMIQNRDVAQSGEFVVIAALGHVVNISRPFVSTRVLEQWRAVTLCER